MLPLSRVFTGMNSILLTSTEEGDLIALAIVTVVLVGKVGQGTGQLCQREAKTLPYPSSNMAGSLLAKQDNSYENRLRFLRGKIARQSYPPNPPQALVTPGVQNYQSAYMTVRDGKILATYKSLSASGKEVPAPGCCPPPIVITSCSNEGTFYYVVPGQNVTITSTPGAPTTQYVFVDSASQTIGAYVPIPPNQTTAIGPAPAGAAYIVIICA